MPKNDFAGYPGYAAFLAEHRSKKTNDKPKAKSPAKAKTAEKITRLNHLKGLVKQTPEGAETAEAARLAASILTAYRKASR